MQFGFVGSGNLARAIARGWGEPVLCTDSGSGRAMQLAEELGGRALGSNLQLAQECDVVVLCHEPHHLDAVADQIRGTARAIVSALAPTHTSVLEAAYPNTAVYRVLVNTAVEVQQGATCLAKPDGAHPDLEAAVIERFGRLGYLEILEERLLDVATCVMGVAPAYQALLFEAQVEAVARHGLSPAVANRLITQTMRGTAALLEAGDFDTLRLRRGVATPGGRTSQGLAALERAGVRRAFYDAADVVMAATPRRPQ